jgi:hypothetical protein
MVSDSHEHQVHYEAAVLDDPASRLYLGLTVDYPVPARA